MERTEPALVPEWLRCSGNVAGGGTSVHPSDVSSSAHSMRSRSFRSNSEKDSPRYLDRSSSSNSRRSSTSNGSAKHPYSSFSRSKNRDKEKGKYLSEDIWDHGSSDPLASVLTSRVERSALRCSQSLVARKPGEPLPQKGEVSRASGNGVPSGSSTHSVIQKAVFEKDFPTLGTEEKQGGAGIKRVSSPGLTSAVQSLPIGNSGFLGGEKWTSALAEVPVILANNGTCQSSLPQSAVTFSKSSSGFCSTAGRNMAEALSQPAARVRTTPQLPDKSQRLEELAIKQSRQLIPMTPAMPKPLVPSSADKSKQPKIAIRTNEMSVASRGVHTQPHSSHPANQSRAGQIRSDCASTSHIGKFLVLKPGRESVSSGAKDASSPTGDVNGKLADGQLAVAPSTPTGPMSPSNSVASALENKAASLSLSSKPTVDKRSSQSLAQSRSEFFNLMRRKTSPSATTNHSDSSLVVSSPNAETSGEKSKEGHMAVSPVLENGNQIMCNGDRCHIPEEIKSSLDVGVDRLPGNGSIYPDEEEAAFLRSLGWDENGGEEEGLTEEEINAFYQEYMKWRPSSEAHQNSRPKFSAPSTLPVAVSVSACSDSSSSESDPEV